MLNILLVTYYGPDSGGIGTSALTLADELKKRGYNVFFASTDEYSGYKNYVFRRFRALPIFYWRDLYLYLFLKRIIKNQSIDIIHCYDYRFSAVAVAKIMQKYKLPGILHFHDYWHNCLRGDMLYKGKDLCAGMLFKKCMNCQNQIKFFWEMYKYNYFKKKKIIARKFNSYISVNKTIARGLGEFWEKEKIFVVNNSVKEISTSDSLLNDRTIEDFINFSENKKIVTFVGGLYPHKGVKIILQLAKSLLGEKIKFAIIGDGDLANYCQDYITNNHLDNIKLLGNVSHKNINYIYQKSYIVIIPSIWPEALPMVMIEAMANGLPIIASDIGGLRETIIDNDNGLLIKPGSVSGFEEAIKKLVNSDELRERIASRSLATAKTFYSSSVANLILEIYQQAIKTNASSQN